ncbi:G-type lectin S-receptor-like serine/threonine-protein kinase At4g27290 [Helianthus annuus]|uniref:Receptor-like serine/threonine-protein kinase n=1 Tax=Helianthus annuus TaxID=4232 RepID=A0A251TAJ6_HELAN|nr:G-type lectin S-receptor-like serine/threonine-protein kinase At4g27290 [Helianthus annuus]
MKHLPIFPFLLTISTLLLTSTTSISTITPNQNISDGQTIISDDELFKMGFFSPSTRSNNRYFGIWYNKISVTTVVWVANREKPLNDTSGVLTLNDQGTLMLLDHTHNIIWSSNSSLTANNNIPVAQLLDTGNLVIRNENDLAVENYLWQSFDYPGDTFLPSMKFGIDFVKGLNKYLTSWKSVDDPSIGEYTNRFDSDGYPQILMRKGSKVEFNSGYWNGLRFSGMPNLKPNDIYTFGFEFNERELYYKYELVSNSVVSRMILNPEGRIQRFIWIERAGEWRLYVSGQMDNCDRYGLCGAYGICNINDSPACACLSGFEPREPEEWRRADWSNGCVRRVELSCEGGDGFVKRLGVKVPDTRRSWYNVSMNIEECERVCLTNCNCTAYATLDIKTRSGCLIWFDDLVDIRSYAEDGQDIFIRMAASELDTKAKAKRRVRVIIVPVLVSATVLLGICLFVYRKRKQKKNGVNSVVMVRENNFASDKKKEDWELPLFDFNTIANATNNFSDDCKLGEGGFGPVYKGILEDGKEIAVKRHSRKSKQGLDEFQNEVKCIAKLQHRNLVKLLGCCIDEDERMLIYEYMPNKSLNSFIFDEGKRKSMDWSKRYTIIIGIGRGLLYLHQDSRLRIIHRDLKASNILLDKDMNPRISDFGLARSLDGSDTKANTRRVMGTYGYMAPEYTIDGIYSTKSDVFSFGVLVLEIVSGKKNRGFRHENHDLNLLGHAWRLYKNGKQLELLDGAIKGSYVHSEVKRSIHVGLLCVQKYPEDRPDMTMVVLMLGSEIPLPEPKQPGFYTERRRPAEAESSSSNPEWSSSNHLSVTHLQPR